MAIGEAEVVQMQRVRSSSSSPSPGRLPGIGLSVGRGGEEVRKGKASTAKLHRRYDELARFLFCSDRHPDGPVPSTGTCLVPEGPFSLEVGDAPARIGHGCRVG